MQSERWRSMDASPFGYPLSRDTSRWCCPCVDCERSIYASKCIIITFCSGIMILIIHLPGESFVHQNHQFLFPLAYLYNGAIPPGKKHSTSYRCVYYVSLWYLCSGTECWRSLWLYGLLHKARRLNVLPERDSSYFPEI